MEQALYISSIRDIGYVTDDFDRLYFGVEFCERLLPSLADLESAIRCARERGLDFTCMTPFVTNAGLDHLERLLSGLAGRLPEAEVVVNDWGVLQLLRSEYPDFKPVLGRLLNKNKRGPRILNILEKMSPESKAYFQGSNLDASPAVRFLLQQGIRRVEFDNLLQGTDFDGLDPKLHKSVYLPYAFVSATRFCLTANCDDPSKTDAIGVFPCGRECLDYRFNLYNPVMTLPLIRRGNAVFFVNENVPDCVSQQLVDRIVVQPELPL